MSIAPRFGSLLYTLSLRAFPRAHRVQFATEMTELFQREIAERGAQRRFMGIRQVHTRRVPQLDQRGVG